jgi:hypothetical protein
MNLQRSLAVLALGAFVPTASAQVFYGTDASFVDNWRLDVTTGTSSGPEFTGVFVSGLADDDAAQIYYIATGASLSTAQYGAGGAATLLGTTTYLGANRAFTGLAAEGGVLYGTHNTGLEGLFAIDVVTLTTTLVYTFPDQEIALEGVDFDPATGLLYGANDGGAYVDPIGAWGRGIVTVDLGQTPVLERLVFPYPVGRTDIDGLAFDPAGRVHLIEDEPSPLNRLDVATGVYDPNPPMNASSGIAVYSAGTYTNGAPVTLGTSYCAAAVNSTGGTAAMSATGSAVASANSVELTASGLPNNAFGFFLTSRTQGFVANPGGSQGNLCLSGSIGRYVGPGQIMNSGTTGSIRIALDLTRQPTPTGFVAVVAGDTWNFTAWHRDVVAGAATSNFANGLSVAFQ